MKSLDEFYDRVKAISVASFNARGEHVPTFLLETRDGMILVPAPWSDQQQKEEVIAAVRELCVKLRVSRAIVIIEGWMVTRPPGTNTDGLTPSKEKDRQEVLWIVGQSNVAGEREQNGFFWIERDAAGKATVGEWVPGDSNYGMSIFDGLVGRGVLQ